MHDNLKHAAELAEKVKQGYNQAQGEEVKVRAPMVHAQVEVPSCHPFTAALHHLTFGRGKATREGWNGRGMHVEAQWPDGQSKMGRPYLFIEDVHGVKTPWVPSQGDLFATDWALLPPNYVNYPF